MISVWCDEHHRREVCEVTEHAVRGLTSLAVLKHPRECDTNTEAWRKSRNYWREETKIWVLDVLHLVISLNSKELIYYHSFVINSIIPLSNSQSFHWTGFYAASISLHSLIHSLIQYLLRREEGKAFWIWEEPMERPGWKRAWCMFKQLKEKHFTMREKSRRKRGKKWGWRLAKTPVPLTRSKSVESLGHYSKCSGESWKAAKPMSDQIRSPGCSGEYR